METFKIVSFVFCIVNGKINANTSLIFFSSFHSNKYFLSYLNMCKVLDTSYFVNVFDRINFNDLFVCLKNPGRL